MKRVTSSHCDTIKIRDINRLNTNSVIQSSSPKDSDHSSPGCVIGMKPIQKF